ncbi:MAG: LysR family transcriptional regulator [Elainellaceae cyanobacterium]|uniref:LysR family transcriptional regulator n=1 Tax=Leptolyngbya sp. CCY15150 TaxID=2767772 RepID=UPI00194F91E2|nr:LysR family transcriptional regulator [Leptolyngbya sp. CCY15150]
MDKFASMQAFVQVVDTGGFAAAARAMGTSRSAVNKLVIHLENELGVQLLHRTTRRVNPTESGLAFYDRCLDILAALEEAELAVSRIHQEPRGNLRINAPMSFGILNLAPAIADFMADYPELQVQLTLNDRFIDPIEEGFDLTVRISETSDFPGVIVHTIAAVQQIVCASPGYLAKHGTPNHPHDLHDHSCLSYGYLSSRRQWRFMDGDQDITVPIHGVLCSNNGDVLRQAALRDLGIVLLPSFIVGGDLGSDRLQRLFTDYHLPPLNIMILYPVNRHLSTKVQMLTEFLNNRFQAIAFES